LILGVVAVLAALMLFSEDGTNKSTRKKRNKITYNYNELSGDNFKDVIKNSRKKDKNLQKQLNSYFQKGLREFREGNYFRAMNQFDLADKISPNDPLAAFYLNKTKKALDNEIQKHFIKARRDLESLKYDNAIIEYCSVIRLLYNYSNDKRIDDAQEGIDKLEEILGYDKGDIKCSKKGK